MLLGGENPGDSFSPSSNGNISANENDNVPMMQQLNGSPSNDSSSSPISDPSLNNVNLLQNQSVPIQQQLTGIFN